MRSSKCAPCASKTPSRPIRSVPFFSSEGTAYFQNGGTLEHAQQIAAHRSRRTGGPQNSMIRALGGSDPPSPAENDFEESLTRVPGNGRPKCAANSQLTRRDKTELATMLGIRESKLGDYTPRLQYRDDSALLRSQNHVQEPRSNSGYMGIGK
jgi:hypothetical protein